MTPGSPEVASQNARSKTDRRTLSMAAVSGTPTGTTTVAPGVEDRGIDLGQPVEQQPTALAAEAVRKVELHHADAVPRLTGNGTGVAVDERDPVPLPGQ